jgi:arabinose-5-phosphate isomerase
MNLLCDVDGILTTGEHFYSVGGKRFKAFGSNEKEALCLLKSHFDKIVLCSADSHGGDINTQRLREFDVTYVSCSIEERQKLVDSLNPCVYIGDGISEPRAVLNICLSDSTPQALRDADIILPTTAGKNVFPHLLHWLEEQNIFYFATKIKTVLKQKVVLAGVGKNYSLAQLVSEFFLPYNIVAVPLDVNHSMHGSLGIIRDDDVLIVSSKSGDTKELLEMMESLKWKIPKFENSFLITSNNNAKSISYFKHTLTVPSFSENSLYGLSPQSTIMQYLKIYFQILNIINIGNSCAKNDYLLNHQGGAIGRVRQV